MLAILNTASIFVIKVRVCIKSTPPYPNYLFTLNFFVPAPSSVTTWRK